MSILLYSTDCPKCKILKKKLNEKKISYTENNSVDEMIALGITQVPIINIDGVFLDFIPAIEWINKQ